MHDLAGVFMQSQMQECCHQGDKTGIVQKAEVLMSYVSLSCLVRVFSV